MGGRFFTRAAMCGASSLLVLLWAFGIHATPAIAAPSSSLLRLTPATLSIPAGGAGNVVAIISNPSATPTANATIDWIAPRGLSVSAVLKAKSHPAASFGSIAAGGQGAVVLSVRRATTAIVPAVVQLRATYSIGSVTHVESAELAINDAPPAAALISVSVVTKVTELQEHRTGEYFIEVKNTGTAQVVIDSVTAAGPSSITWCYAPTGTNDCPNGAATITAAQLGESSSKIPGGRTQVYAFTASASDGVQPGPKQLLFDVTAHAVGDPRQTSNVVVPQDVNLSIIGETSFLSVVGVPSFLLLPGFLFLIFAGVAWGIVRKAPTGEPPPPADNPDTAGKALAGLAATVVQWTNAQFWATAVALSLVAMLIYGPVTDFFGHRRSYLDGYGLRDIQIVWLGSLGLGFAVGLILAGVPWSWRKARAVRTRRELARRTPTTYDSPIQLLRRLREADGRLVLSQATTAIDGVRVQWFVFPEKVSGGTWLFPPIRLGLDGMPAGQREEIVSQLEAGDLESALSLLDDATLASQAQLSWRGTYKLGGPRLIHEDKLGPETSGRLIIERADR